MSILVPTTDRSQLARELGADVIELDMRVPFTAARARNVGFRRLREISPDIEYVQFVDGDCKLIAGWLEDADFVLERSTPMSPRCAAGDASVIPTVRSTTGCATGNGMGRSETCAMCGGDVMMRADAL